MFVGICGIIGGGKTTFCKGLSKTLNYIGLYEPVKDNSYLSDFYKFVFNFKKVQKQIDTLKIPPEERFMYESSIPFNIQIEFLWKRYLLHQQACFAQPGAVQDRVIYEDSIFAKMLYDDGMINKRDFLNYTGIFGAMKHTLEYPDVLIYLQVKPEVAFERLKTRGRIEEKNVPLEYLQNLNDNYEEFIKEISTWCPVYTLDWNKNINLVNGDYEKTIQHISEDINMRKENSNFYKRITRI